MLQSVPEIYGTFRRSLCQYVETSQVMEFKKLSMQLRSQFGTEIVTSTRDERAGFEGKTLLHHAARVGNNEIVTHLLSMGHSVDPWDSSNSKVTPLMEAVARNFIETAVILIEAGASVGAQDVNMENVFHYAARNGSSKLIKLIARASDLSQGQLQELMCATDIKKRFPEDLAARSLAGEVLKNLRQLGAHPQYDRRNQKSQQLQSS